MMKKTLVFLITLLMIAIFPPLLGAKNIDSANEKKTQVLTLKELFNGVSYEDSIEPTPSSITPIILPDNLEPIIVKMPVPDSQHSWEFLSTSSPIANSKPSFAFPIGVGSIAYGGNTFNIQIGLGQFTGPVDVYFGLVAPAIDPKNVYFLRSDDSLQSFSVEDLRKRKIKKLEKILSNLHGIQPWRKSTIDNISMSLTGNIQTSSLPSGQYDIFLVASKAGDTNLFYEWKTSVKIVNYRIPSLNIFPLRPSPWDIIHLSGDLTITQVMPVQVLDGAPFMPLIVGKSTVFRVKIKSTFVAPVNASVRLTLPSDSWSVVNKTGDYIETIPYQPDTFGPFTIKPGDNEIILPHIPQGQENNELSASNPYGIIKGRFVGSPLAFWSGPDVRALPCPASNKVPTRLTVTIDPDNSVVETNEENNLYSYGADAIYYYPLETKPWRFLFVPSQVPASSGTCIPHLGTQNNNMGIFAETSRRALEFVLATFPIADSEIKYAMWFPTRIVSCSDNPNQLCGESITQGQNEGPGAFFQRIDQIAKSISPDIFGVATSCGKGGQMSYGVDPFLLGEGNIFNMAHEFNHVVTGMGDIYTLDCNGDWSEAYCENDSTIPPTRRYCCDPDDSQPQMPFCYYDATLTMQCGPYQKNCVKDCDNDIPLGSSWNDCWSVCDRLCPPSTPNETLFITPDGRTTFPASKGFWTNKWMDIDPSNFTYFMDEATATSWTVVQSSRYHCKNEIYQDGWINLIRNDRFVDCTCCSNGTCPELHDLFCAWYCR
jgi:hypothetical protein